MVINKYLGLCVLGIVGLVWWLSAVDRTGVETEMTEPPVYLAQVQPIEQGVTAGRNWSNSIRRWPTSAGNRCVCAGGSSLIWNRL